MSVIRLRFWAHRPDGGIDFVWQVQYLYEKHHSLSAVETLAVLHSLPYAFLTWAWVVFSLSYLITVDSHSSIPRMLSFVVAFCCMCFIGTNIVNRVIVGIAFCITCLLFIWCIKRVSGMETQRQESYKSLFTTALEKLRLKSADGSQKTQPSVTIKEAGANAV